MNLEKLKQLHSELIEHASRVIDSVRFSDPAIYGAWLAQSYFFVRHSSRLLCLTAARAPLTVSDDTFHLRTLSHIGEEKGHEKLALRDLKELGLSIDNYVELAATRAFYRSQYYFIQNVTPHAFMGYVLFLEGLAAARGKHVLTEAVQNFPKATTFIKLHAEEDIDHVAKALGLLDSIPASSYPAIAESLRDSAFFYTEMLSHLEQAQIKAAGRSVSKNTAAPEVFTQQTPV